MKDLNTRNRVWVKPIDQMDVWLDNEGYYRKHTARDATCLFRAVSEQIFLTQAFHLDLRRQIIEFMLRNENYFQKFISCPLMEYAEKMYSPKEWGGRLEIDAMSLMYKCDFIVFKELETPPENVTKHGFKKELMLCYTQERHYDSVYTKDYITVAALCQSTIYELLYKRVFELKEVDYAVNKMLHDKNSRYQREHIPFLSSGFALRLEMRDSYLNVKDLLDFGITPFPYKVAKSLDPEIYRNVEYDTWNEYRKGLRYGFCPWTCQEIQVGAKCLVKLEEGNYHGHVQEMQPNKGPVVVFVEELGEMKTVPFDTLELLPPANPANNIPRPVIPLKLHPLQLIDLKTGKLPLHLFAQAPLSVHQSQNSNEGKKGIKNLLGKMKQTRDNDCNIRSEKPTKTRDIQSPQTPVVSSTEYSEQDAEYREEVNGFSPQQFQTVSDVEEEVCPDSTKPETVLPVTQMDSYRYPIYQAQPQQPAHPPTTLPLPLQDQATVYQQPVTVNLMAPKSLNMDGSDLPHSDVATLRFFYNLGLDHLRMNYLVRPGTPYYVSAPIIQQSFIPVESPTVPYEPFPCPIQGVKRQNTLEGSPLIQQCEVSSTVNAAPQPPTFYQPADCEQYCMSVPYVDYSYDYPIYPSSPHALLPSSYITPDGLIYHSVIPTSTVLSQPPPPPSSSM